MKKWLIAIVLLLCFGVGGLTFYMKLSSDGQGPVISCGEDLFYQRGMTQEELLSGVTAVDEADGDVTESLVVESVTENEEKSQAIVVYVARDSKNNITKVRRVLPYSGKKDQESKKETETQKTGFGAEAGAETGTGTKSETGDETGTETQTETGIGTGTETKSEIGAETGTGTQTETGIETETESESEELNPGAPIITLTEKQVEIKKGESFNPLEYVAAVVDDYDDKYSLWRDIQISGEYDVNETGKYELYFFVVDSAGNTSNRAKLVLTVKEK